MMQLPSKAEIEAACNHPMPDNVYQWLQAFFNFVQEECDEFPQVDEAAIFRFYLTTLEKRIEKHNYHEWSNAPSRLRHLISTGRI